MLFAVYSPLGNEESEMTSFPLSRLDVKNITSGVAEKLSVRRTYWYLRPIQETAIDGGILAAQVLVKNGHAHLIVAQNSVSSPSQIQTTPRDLSW